MSIVSAADGNESGVYSEPYPETIAQAPVEEDSLQSDDVAASSANESAYLVLDNDADIENVQIGELVKWIISVENRGPDTAKNVKVYDQLPEGLKYISHSATKGTFNPQTGIWFIGNLSVADGEVILYITTEALTLGEKVNKAQLTSDTFNPNSNESYEEEEIDVVEREDSDDSESSMSLKEYQTGNPLVLLLLSFIALTVPLKRYK